jgi:transposase-like protein
MTHEQTNAMWLARWQGLRSSGLKMTEYAPREGFNAHSAYRWLRRARRDQRVHVIGCFAALF